MYARVVKFALGPDSQWESERIADVMCMRLKSQPGFINAHFLADYANSEYTWISFWESEECISFGKDSVYSQLVAMLGDNVPWKPLAQVYKVYVPKDLVL